MELARLSRRRLEVIPWERTRRATVRRKTLAMPRITQQIFIYQERWLIKYTRASKNVCLIAHDEGWFARMENNFQDGRKYEGLSLLTTPNHLQNLHLLRYTFVTVTHYSQIHRLIPQHSKQWPEAKAEQIKLSAFLWSLVNTVSGTFLKRKKQFLDGQNSSNFLEDTS